MVMAKGHDHAELSMRLGKLEGRQEGIETLVLLALVAFIITIVFRV